MKIFKRKKTLFSEWEQLEKEIRNSSNKQIKRLGAWHKRYDSCFRHCDYVPWANYGCEPSDEEILSANLLDASPDEISEWADKRVGEVVTKQKEEYMAREAEPILWALEKYFTRKKEESKIGG